MPSPASPPAAATHKHLKYALLSLVAFTLFSALLSTRARLPSSVDKPELLNAAFTRAQLPFSPSSSSSSYSLDDNTAETGEEMQFARPTGKVSVGYFVNWGIYARAYKPSNIPVEDLTHLLYAFADLKEDGEVVLTDKWSDEEIHYDGDSWNDVGTNLYGNLKQLHLLKQRNRHLKLLLSIGGWTYSPHFARPMATPLGRARFVESALKLVEDYGLDGLDIDWEYPENDAQARDYVELLRLLREGLDGAARRKGMDLARNEGYDLTVAAPCGPDKFQVFRIREMDQYLTFWNLMAYDYAGSWDTVTNHQAALYSSSPTGLSTDRAVRHYTSVGAVPTQKLVIGIPLYGRSFMNTDGVGTPFSGVGKGSWEAGSYDYKSLPLPSSTVQTDPRLVASSCYDPSTREFVSFDTPASVALKMDWLLAIHLGGVMVWELSGDKERESGESLVRGMAERMRMEGTGLDARENCVRYGESKWDNLRKGMGA